MNRVISFASGKGGVGKTSLVANLGTLFSKQGEKTLLVDADWSLGKLGILFGKKPKWTIDQVLKGEITLRDAATEVSPTLSLLASPSGVEGFEELGETARQQLFFELDGLKDAYDWVLLDHSSGIHHGVLPFAAAAHQHVIVTTCEPTSYTDAYAIMKLLSKRFGVKEFALVVTMAGDRAEAGRIMDRFIDVAHSHLQVRVRLLDIFSWEPKMAEAIRRQTPFVDLYPNSDTALRLEKLSQSIALAVPAPTNGLRFFYQDVVTSNSL